MKSKASLMNFVVPGASQYHLKPEQLEEVLRKQNSASKQLKKTMSDSMAINTEKLREVMSEQLGDKTEKRKNMFGKRKSRIQQKKILAFRLRAPVDLIHRSDSAYHSLSTSTIRIQA